MCTFNNKMITQTHASVRRFFAIARSIERIQFCELQSRLLHLRSSRCTIVSLLCRAVIKDKGVYCNICRRSAEAKDGTRHFRPEIASLPVHFENVLPSELQRSGFRREIRWVLGSCNIIVVFCTYMKLAN